MLSASAYPVSSKSVGPGRSRRRLHRFLHRLLGSARSRMPMLPDDLRGDAGLGEKLPESRTDAFWNEKRRSGARDLPL